MSPLNPGKAVSIDEFIASEVENFTASDFVALRDHVPALRSKMQTEQARIHYDLQQGVELLIDWIEDEDLVSDENPLPAHLAEAGVAAAYILKGVDLIPDSIPEIGLTDDARILARVLDRNPTLRRDVR
ncbi:MAG: DUF1232 domain-containing protein [Spartobacteria bacterium]